MSTSMSDADVEVVNDEAMSNFLTFTGCVNADVALSYLEMSGGDLETAVGLYLEHGSNSSVAPRIPRPAATSTTTTTLSSSRQPLRRMMNDDDEDEDDFIPVDEDYVMNNDAAWFTSSSNATDEINSNNNNGAPYIRAPDQTQRMRLMDDDDNHPLLGNSSRFLSQQHHHHHQQQQQQQPSAALFAGEVPDQAAMALMMGTAAEATSSSSSIWGSENSNTSHNNQLFESQQHHSRQHARATSSSTSSDTTRFTMDARAMVNAAAAAADTHKKTTSINNNSKNSTTLQNMFAPPSYAHRGGGFQGARNTARDARRWLLVNLQSDEDFACHALNRDVWADELVGNLVQDGFIFWQQMRTSPDGMTYVQRYNVQAFPHIGIIDPRTGRLMWRKEGWTHQENQMTCEMFAEIAADFCSRHSFDKPPVAPKSTLNVDQQPIKKRTIEDMTEEEQLEAALKASMNDDIIMGDDDDDDDDVPITANNSNNHNEQQQQQLDEKKLDTTTNASSSYRFRTIHIEVEEPSSHDAVRIQFRMPEGQRVVRRFLKSDSILIIYAFVYQYLEKQSSSSTIDAEIQLRAGFPPMDLFSQLDDGTVESCGLAGGQVVASWK